MTGCPEDEARSAGRTGTERTDTGPTCVEITYYTDPLCCWSWALEPQWRRLRCEYGRWIRWRYRMGGLLADWSRYDDPINAVSRPAQMGPVWMQASHLSGMPIRDRIWMEDPPSSSYPACVGVKAAAMQSHEAGEVYLRRLREAVMCDGRNIARRAVLVDVARELADDVPAVFSAERFTEALESDAAVEAFRQDLVAVRYRDISRFPTLVLQAETGRGVMAVGYRPYEALRAALLAVAPELESVERTERVPSPAIARSVSWGTLTDRELREVAVTAPEEQR